MYPDSPYAHPIGSFQFPVAVPDVDPGDEPLETLCINSEWLMYLRGAAKQLLLQTTWYAPELGALEAAQGKAFDLISRLQQTDGCCTITVPNWIPQVENTQPDVPYQLGFFGQRGEGLNGPFYAMTVLVNHARIYFVETGTSNLVGGVVNYFECAGVNDPQPVQVNAIDCLGNNHTAMTLDRLSLDDLFPGEDAPEVKSFTVASADWVYVRLVMKFNWTCGEA